jgi:hypothetical protein
MLAAAASLTKFNWRCKTFIRDFDGERLRETLAGTNFANIIIEAVVMTSKESGRTDSRNITSGINPVNSKLPKRKNYESCAASPAI